MVCPSLCLRAARPESVYLLMYQSINQTITLQGTNISTLGKGKSSSKCHVWGICWFPGGYSYPWWIHVWYIYLHEWLFLMVKCGKCIGKYTILGFYGILFSQLHQLFFLPCPSQYPQTKQKEQRLEIIDTIAYVCQMFPARNCSSILMGHFFRLGRASTLKSNKINGPFLLKTRVHPMVAW